MTATCARACCTSAQCGSSSSAVEAPYLPRRGAHRTAPRAGTGVHVRLRSRRAQARPPDPPGSRGGTSRAHSDSCDGPNGRDRHCLAPRAGPRLTCLAIPKRRGDAWRLVRARRRAPTRALTAHRPRIPRSCRRTDIPRPIAFRRSGRDCPVVQRLAHRAHAARERVLVDVASVPELVQQLGTRHQPVAVWRRDGAAPGRAGWEGGGQAAAAAQPAGRRLELELADQESRAHAAGSLPQGRTAELRRALFPHYFSFS